MKFELELELGEAIVEQDPTTFEIKKWYKVDLSDADVIIADPKHLSEDQKRAPVKLIGNISPSGTLELRIEASVSEDEDKKEAAIRRAEDRELEDKRKHREEERKSREEKNREDEKSGVIHSTSPSGAPVTINKDAKPPSVETGSGTQSQKALRDTSQPSIYGQKSDPNASADRLASPESKAANEKMAEIESHAEPVKESDQKKDDEQKKPGLVSRVLNRDGKEEKK